MYNVHMSRRETDMNINLDSLTKEQLITVIQEQQKQIETLNHNYDLLVEQLSCMTQNRFGRKTESSSDITQLSIFNEAEDEADPSVKESEEIEQVIPSYTRKKKTKGKREGVQGRAGNRRISGLSQTG